jgi:hypothetical protein
MAYGSDITEAGEYKNIAFALSNPVSASSYTLTDFNYDVSINTMPFFLMTSDNSPYRRVTAQYRKDQYDQTREAGEQSLTGWWFRSQSSFHLGQGIKYFEPAQDESLRFQYTESKGCDVWTKGQVTLLNSTVRALSSANTPIIIGANDGTNDCLVVADGTDLKKITMSSDTPTSSTYTQAGTASTIFDLTTDGTRYWFVNTTHVHRGNIGGATGDTEIYNASSTTSARIRYVKQRLIASINNTLRELDPAHTGGGALPAAFYTHPQTDWTWTTIAEGPQAIYVGGYSRKNSSIYKITLDLTNSNALGFPEFNIPTVVVDLPEGEIINTFDTYLGTYAILCTNKGVRVGVLGTDGDLTYGPLLFETECTDVVFRDKFAYVSTTVDGESGLVRINLAEPVIANSLVFAYSWDVYAASETTTSNSTAFLGATDRVAFCVPGDGVWIESYGVKVTSGYLQTGYVRYNTLENKIFKLLNPRVDTTNGAIALQSVDSDGVEYAIGGAAQGTPAQEVGVPYPVGPQEYLAFKFTLSRSSSDTTKGPLFTGYQLKSLPAVPRQRLIQLPVACFDRESDSMGNEVGYDGRAYDRLSQLETIESAGDTVRIEDFRTGEVVIALIEEMDFRNVAPSDKRFTGYGGLLLVTARTV